MSMVLSNEVFLKKRFFEECSDQKGEEFNRRNFNSKKQNQSTPSSSTNLMIQSIEINKQSNLERKYIVSSVFNDITSLKKEFGIYNPYELDQYKWFGKIKAICKKNYQNPDDIIQFFHLFIDKMYHVWALNLKVTTLDQFEKEFYDEIFRSKQEMEDEIHLNQADYLDKLNTIYKNDKLVLKEIKDYPLSSFFKYKSLSNKELIKLVIFMFKEENIKIKLERYINTSFKDVYDTLKIIDEINSSK